MFGMFGIEIGPKGVIYQWRKMPTMDGYETMVRIVNRHSATMGRWT